MATSEEVMAVLGDERGPMDYSEWGDERRLLIGIIRKQAEGGGGNYSEGGSPLLKWILGVLSALTVSVVVGAIAVYGRFTSLETKVSEWQSSTQRQIDSQADRLNRLENRRQ